MGSSAGGAFLPNDPPPSSGAVLTNPVFTGATIVGGTISGATISGGSQTSTGSTFTSPTLVTPTVSGATIAGTVTIASGATITTPTLPYTVLALTATGTGSGDAASMGSVYPAIVTVTGATGSGVALPAAAAVPGAWYQLNNLAAATIRVYSSGALINGTTGTSAVLLTNTGNKLMTISCVVAGAWLAAGNT
jgi:hypothetical protein